MTYLKSQMFYTNYKWTAKADHDNPKIIYGTDHTELNRMEGYEMLYFINSLTKTWEWKNASVESYQKLEKVIKEQVPSSIRTHGGIKDWISANYQSF